MSAADSMAAAAAVQVTTTTATTTTVAANAAAVVAAAVAIGIGGSAPAVAEPIITGTGPAAVIETNGVSISYDVIAAISQAHLTNCDYTDELTRTLLRKPVASPVIIPYDILDLLLLLILINFYCYYYWAINLTSITLFQRQCENDCKCIDA